MYFRLLDPAAIAGVPCSSSKASAASCGSVYCHIKIDSMLRFGKAWKIWPVYAVKELFFSSDQAYLEI
jgi:hypothetical protein